MLSVWPVPEACVKQLQSYWSTWLVTSSPTFVVFEAVSLLSVCETSSWWVEQRFGGYVPPCLDSNTWGHILTFASLSRQSHALCDEALWCARLVLVPIPDGCGAKRFGPLPRLGLFQLAAIALICGVRIPLTIGVARSCGYCTRCYNNEVWAWVVFNSGRARSRAELYSAQPCLSNMHVIVCGEPWWAWIYWRLCRMKLLLSLPGCFSSLVSKELSEQSLLRV